MILHLIPQAVILCFSVITSAQDESDVTEKPYAVLQKQNLVTLGSVLAVLLLLMIVMAVCVYKPLARR